MIKAIALDIYGTVLAGDDCDNEMPPRTGLAGFFNFCSKRNIPIIGASDADIMMVKLELKVCFENHPEGGMSVGMFRDFVLMNQRPVKDYRALLYSLREAQKLDIPPKELFVIGDSYKDIDGAMGCGCPYFQVPYYYMRSRDKFDFKEVADFIRDL